MTHPFRSASRRVRLLALVPLLALLCLVGWSVSSPIGSSPDDDFHLASIWCGLGEREGLCEATGDPATRLIPTEITTSAACYAYNPEQSAACLIDYPAGENAPMVEASRGNFQGLYPAVFYAVAGIFASPDIAGSTIVIRIVNSAIFVAIASLLFLLLPPPRRSALVWGYLATMVPLGLFIVASTNPSGWAVVSAGVLWLSLVEFMAATTLRRRALLGAFVIVAAVIGAGSRADAAVFSALAAVVAVVLTFERTRAYAKSLWLPALVIVMSAGFYLSAGQGVSAAGGLAAGAGTNPFVLLAYNLLNLPLLWAGIFGSFGLGWLDTTMPAVVALGGLAVFVAVVFSGIAKVDRRKAIALGLIGLALIAVPSYVLVQSNAIVGAYVQPRYLLPLLIMFAGVALSRVLPGPALSTVQRWTLAVLLIVAQSVALHFNLRRYLTGLDVGSWNLNADLEWWWATPVSPMVVWIVGSVAFGAMVVILVRALDPMVVRRPAERFAAVPAGPASID